MVKISLPFLGRGSKGNGAGDWHNEPLRSHDETSCAILAKVSAELSTKAAQNQHLSEYLHVALEENDGVPEYVDKLSRKYKDVDNPNLVYAIGGGLFVHVFPNPRGPRQGALCIYRTGDDARPRSTCRSDRRQATRCGRRLREANTVDERRETLLEALEQVVEVKGGENGAGSARHPDPVRINDELYEALRYVMVRDKIEQGAIQPLIYDTNLEDISCSGLGPIFLEHKIFDSVQSNVVFETMEQLDKFVVQLSEKIGRPVTRRDPVADAALLDGSRINIVYGGEVSKRGSNFSIRKVAEEPLSILTLIEFDSISYEMAAYLSMALAHGMNIFVCGETASGKTTLINALTTFIKPTAKIVSIEDTCPSQNDSVVSAGYAFT